MFITMRCKRLLSAPAVISTHPLGSTHRATKDPGGSPMLFLSKIYLSSYKDNDGNGINGLTGIISKPDYIQSTGFKVPLVSGK